MSLSHPERELGARMTTIGPLEPVASCGARPTAPRPSSRPCLDAALSIWGWVFDIFTISISIADVVSDILVAIQFYTSGHRTWFWLVMASLFLSNIIYTVFSVEVILRENLRVRPFRPLLYILVFPVAQLAPTANWLIEKIHPSSFTAFGKSGDWAATFGGEQNGDGPSSPQPTTAAEESRAIATEAKVMERLERALQEHLRTHVLLYIETVVESIPQSVIQLLAITFLGQASWEQVLSMSLSLLSIVSKAYVISHSFTIKMMVFKFMLAAHDVFSLFYIFSTILSKDEAKDVTIAGREVSLLSYIWLIKFFTVTGYGVCAALVFGLVMLVDQLLFKRQRCSCDLLKESFLFTFLALLITLPAAIAAEGAKLLWGVQAVSACEPRSETFPIYSLIYSFVSRGNYYERVRYVLKSAVLYRASAGKRGPRVKGRRRLPDASVDAPVVAATSATAAVPVGGGGEGLPHQQSESEREHEAVLRQGGVSYLTYLVLHEVPFNPKDLYLKVFWNRAEVDPATRTLIPGEGKRLGECPPFPEIMGIIGLVVGGVLYVISQLYSLVFPFVNYSWNFEKQNPLQHFCFTITAFAALVALLLAPSSYAYTWFCLEMEFFRRHLGASSSFATVVRGWIADYHVPPHTLILQQAVPLSLLPSDVVGVVAEFLDKRDINLSHLTIAECQAIRRRMVAPVDDVSDAEIGDMLRCSSGSGGGAQSVEPADATAAATGAPAPAPAATSGSLEPQSDAALQREASSVSSTAFSRELSDVTGF